MDIGKEGVIDHGAARRRQRFAERLLRRRRRPAEEHEIAAARDRAGAHEGDRRLLQDRVDRVDARRDVFVVDDRECGGLLHHVILKWSTRTQRRQREKLRGPVIPSPVGLAMVNEQYPSPSRPRPACERAFFTKIEQSQSLAMRLRLSRFFECMIAVWRLPPSTSTAKSMARVAFGTRQTGITGIICSVQSSGWSSFTSTTTRRTESGAVIPSLPRITFAFLPMRSLLRRAFCRGPFISAKTTRSSSGRRFDGSTTAFCRAIEAMRASAMEATAKVSFSSVQMMVLSVEAPRTMSRAALSMSAVSSTTTGGLPGPAQIARLPLCIAVFTTSGPPVTTTRRTPRSFISSCADSMVGLATPVTTFGGPPAPTIALLSSAMVCMQQFFAYGWTLKTTLFPAASMPMELQMIVDVGFVTGVIAPMTPNGAGSTSVRPRSPLVAIGARSSRPGVFSVTRRFLTILSS